MVRGDTRNTSEGAEADSDGPPRQQEHFGVGGLLTVVQKGFLRVCGRGTKR